ncbi:MAG: clostripain-related cysteine peptidase [Promethearchaeota archaeon]
MIRRDGRRYGNFGNKIALLLAVLLIISAIFAASPIWANSKGSRDKWTFMVYLDGDNNLDYYGYLNVDAMTSVGSSRDVNIIVLWDKYDDVGNLYRITDKPELVQGFPLNGEETNMGDPETLETFVKYSMSSFRANHYALVLWDHGDDYRGCCWDDHPHDHLTHQEITQALSGVELDILAFDACVEGMIEVVYEYAWDRKGPKIDYIVGTEGYVPGWGYPYATILSDLTNNPTMDAFDFSKVIIDRYIAYYEALRPASRLVELASIDMSYVTTIVQQFGDLTDVLEELLENDNSDKIPGKIASARGAGNLGWSEYGWEAYIDMPTFVKSLHKSLKIKEAKTLYETLTAALYVETTNSMSSAEGLGIFFPNSYSSFQNKWILSGEEYLNMQFPHEGWWDFLQTYWGI